jgi:LysM repeat protein
MNLDLESAMPRASAAALLVLSLGAPALTAQQPAAPAQTRPATHTVKRGDTLWDLAKSYLGDAFLWPEIYRLNTDQIEDPHWIYPGEVLKLPGDAPKVIAQAPAPTPPPETTVVVTPVVPVPMTPEPLPALMPKADTNLAPAATAPAPAVRMGEYIASPWVDQRGGPRGSGFLMGSRDLPGIASVDRSRLNLHDRVLVSPPVGSVAPEKEMYLTYRMGPLLEDLGQIVIPTGIIEITRSARNGEAAIGKVVKMFGEVQQGQRLVPIDTSAAVLSTLPSPIANGKTGKVRWLYNNPVLPSIQSYLVLDISRRDVTTGDQIDLYYPRQKPQDGRELAIPEVWIARAQILRVTPYGATAIIVRQEQPKIEEGTAARVAAKMP